MNLAPPGDMQDFVNYAAAVATRYKGRIRYYQVWNEPNIYPEWGNQAVNPEAYTDLLCRTHDAFKAIDPSITIISATLAQTIELTDANLSDFVFLQRMYDAGRERCFDILGAQGYGLFSGPSDRRMRLTTINFSHVLWLRDMMIANDDADKPIWIGEMAWNYVPDEAAVPQIIDRLKYGQVTEEQAARYAVEAYQRAAESGRSSACCVTGSSSPPTITKRIRASTISEWSIPISRRTRSIRRSWTRPFANDG